MSQVAEDTIPATRADQAIWIGDHRPREWSAIVTELLESIPVRRLSARHFIQQQRSVDWTSCRYVFLAVTLPGQFGLAFSQAIERHARHANRLRIHGPWCERTMRMDAKETGWTTIPWHQFSTWWLRHRPRLSPQVSASTCVANVELQTRSRPMSVAVHSRSGRDAEIYREAIEAFGYVPVPPSQRAGSSHVGGDAWIWDDPVVGRGVITRLQQFLSVASVAPGIAILHPNHISQARLLSDDLVILAKPWHLDDLQLRLEECSASLNDMGRLSDFRRIAG